MKISLANLVRVPEIRSKLLFTLTFLALYRLNPTYCMILFEDPIGQQMLAAAIFRSDG